MDPVAAKAVIERFVALGYIQPQTENQDKAVASAVREGNYNLSRDYMDSRRPQDALPLLEELARENPKEMRFKLQLAQCYLSLGRTGESKAVLKEVLEFKPDEPAEKAGEPAPDATEATPPAVPVKKGAVSRPWADWLIGTMELADGKTEDALASLLRAEQGEPHLPNLHLRIGETYLRCKRVDDAMRAFQRALEIDGDSPEAHVGLSMVYLRQRRPEEAASEALMAVGLQHFSPLGHFNLGIALARLGQRDRAVLAFETALTMLPGFAAAHRWLGVLYGQSGGDAVKAARHRYLYDQLRRRKPVATGGPGAPGGSASAPERPADPQTSSERAS
jgi:tetratricopeptide (TPR) repeat protein